MSTIPTIPSTVQPLTRAEMAQFLPTKRAIDVFAALTQDVPAVVAQSNLAVQQIDDFTFDFDELNATVISLQEQIDGISASSGAISPLVGDGTTGNAVVVQGFLGPAERGGSLIAANAVGSFVNQAGTFRLESLIDIDPQLSMSYTGRGAIVFTADAHLPGIVPGTPGTGTRTGGGGPAALMRMIRRAPGIGKQAYENLVGGFNLDGGSGKLWDNFTVDATTNTFTATAHGRNVGDMLFVDSDGTTLPTPLDKSTPYYVINTTTNTFQFSLTLGGSALDITASGSGVWTTNLNGIRLPNNQPSSNPNDPDQDFDTKKAYTAGSLRDIDINGFSGSGFVGEAGNGRLHCHSVRSLNNRLHGFDLAGNDIIFSGHWAAGGNGGFGIKLGQAAGFYAWGGNLWSNPNTRGPNGGALWINGRSYYVIGGTEFNDWIRCDGGPNFNNAGVLVGNLMHQHGVNFSSDGVGIDQGTGDSRLQAAAGFQEYQGTNLIGNGFVRTDTVGNHGTFTVAGNTLTSNAHGLSNGNIVYTVIDARNVGAALAAGLVQGTPYFVVNKTTNTFQVSLTLGGAAVVLSTAGTAPQYWTDFPVWGNFGGDLRGTVGTAPKWLWDFGGGSTVSMSQMFDGYCTAPDVKPFTGPFSNVTFGASTSVTWTAHPLVAGDRVSFHTTGALPATLTPDTLQYYVASVIDANTFTVSATWGGTAINVSGAASGTQSCYQLSACPYNVHASAQIVHVSLDSYRGQINIGSRNGVAPKFLIGMSQTAGWEGNPSYRGEMGDSTVHSGLPYRNALYGAWEADYAPQLRATALNRVTFSNGQSKTITPYAAQAFYNVSGSSIASGTIVLPQAMTSGYELLVIINGAINGLTWTATLNSKSPPLPTATTTWTAIRLQYLCDGSPATDEWNVINVFGNEGYTVSLGTTGALAADCKAARSFLYGPLTGNCTINNPIAGQDGVLYTFMVKEDATGGRTVTLGTKFRKAGAPAFTTTANAVNIFQAKYCANDDKYDIVNFQAGIV